MEFEKTYVVHRVQVLLVIDKVDRAQPPEHVRPLELLERRLGALAAGLFAVGFLEELGEVGRDLDVPVGLRPLRAVRVLGVPVADIPAVRVVDAAVPPEVAALILVPVEWNEQDVRVRDRVRVQKVHYVVDHVGVGDPVQDVVLLNAETSVLRMGGLRLRAGAVQIGVVDAVRAERRQDGKVRLVLEEEPQVAESLAGRVARREIVAQDTVHDERIPLLGVAVSDRRRNCVVIDELDLRLGVVDVVRLPSVPRSESGRERRLLVRLLLRFAALGRLLMNLLGRFDRPGRRGRRRTRRWRIGRSVRVGRSPPSQRHFGIGILGRRRQRGVAPARGQPAAPVEESVVNAAD